MLAFSEVRKEDAVDSKCAGDNGKSKLMQTVKPSSLLQTFGRCLEDRCYSFDKQHPTFLTEDFTGMNPDSIFTSTITMLEPLRSPV